MLASHAGSFNGYVLPLLQLTLIFSALTGQHAQVAEAPERARIVTVCDTVSRTDVERALGRRVGNGEAGDSTCRFAVANGEVTVSIQRVTAAFDISGEIEHLKTAIPDSRLRDDADIGAPAFFLDIRDAGTQLFVLRDKCDFIMVSILGFGDASQVSEAAGQIARTALSRLAPPGK